MQTPIFFYHAIFNKQRSNDKYTISKEAFKQHIRYLAENGFKGLFLDNLFTSHSLIDGSGKNVIITFDDGHYSDYSIAFPILKEYKFIATFFVTLNWIGSKDYVTWLNLKEMIDNGMSVQSHGLSHSFLSDLDNDNLYTEIHQSKFILERELHSPVNYISLPGGRCSKKVLAVAKEAHYKGVCTSAPGLDACNAKRRSFTVFNRFLITQKTSFNEFKSIVNGDTKLIAKYKVEYYLKDNLKRILGDKSYYKIWTRFFKKV
jgi:peptidoglycan/xylan/chitin deacetylase (PgdA/CDA1 family)